MSVVVCVSISFGEEREMVKSQKMMTREEMAERTRERKREKKGKEKDVTRRVLNHYQSTKENGLGKMGKSEKSSRLFSPSKKAIASTPLPPSVNRDTSVLLQAR